jgi:hypothetical protein
MEGSCENGNKYSGFIKNRKFLHYTSECGLLMDSAAWKFVGWVLCYKSSGNNLIIVVLIQASPPRPERLWGPPSLLYNGYQGLFPWDKGAGT